VPETEWVVLRGDARYPVPDVQTLRSWAAQGNVQSDDRIWHPLKAEWIIARDVPEIADAIVPRSMVPTNAAVPVKGDSMVGLRAAGYLIDLLPSFLIGVIALVPVVGQFFAGILLGCYWLLRDVMGASLGKLLLGTEVVDLQGNRPQTSALITRNITIAAGAFLLAIPILGYLVGIIVSTVAFWVEVIMLATQGQRLGDKLAATTVVRKR
jgi:uncharacterized RDD family membrane protein YckC